MRINSKTMYRFCFQLLDISADMAVKREFEFEAAWTSDLRVCCSQTACNGHLTLDAVLSSQKIVIAGQTSEERKIERAEKERILIRKVR